MTRVKGGRRSRKAGRRAPAGARKRRGGTPVLALVRQVRVPRTLRALRAEVDTLRREMLRGVDRVAKQIERFGRALQKRVRS